MCLTLTRIWSPTKFVPEINSIYLYNWGFPSDSLVKNLPAIQEMQETLVWSLGQEDPLEDEMATCSSTVLHHLSLEARVKADLKDKTQEFP